MVLGLRGLPDVQGGVETHAEQLYKRLVAHGCEIEVLVRTPFSPPGQRSMGAVRIRRLWAPRRPGLEALLHSVLGVLYAGIKRPDILHIHAVGPAIVAPLARLLALRVVVTHHGPDYDRDKWGPLARWILRSGERFGMRYSQARIAISKVIAELVRTKYGRDSDLIPNGVVVTESQAGTEHPLRFGLQPGRYFLQVSRIVPEKRQLDLIEAFSLARPPGWRLALVGGLGADAYSDKVRTAARDCKDVVLTDFAGGIVLQQLYSHAGVFVLPSSHEGLPIAMLEALSYGLPVLASDIPANLEVGLPAGSYFPVGNVAALASALKACAHSPMDETARRERREWVARTYDWDRIAAETAAVYRRVVGSV